MRRMRLDLTELIALFVVTTGLLCFVLLANWIDSTSLQDVDHALLRGLRDPERPSEPRGPWWISAIALDITALGSAVVLTLVTVSVLVFLLIERRYRAAALVLAATVLGVFLERGLKAIIARQRPDIVPHLTNAVGLSFPSGHSMMSAVVYMTLAALLARIATDKRARVFVISFAAFLIALVGASRVYLGVHYPSDVIAGWSVGTAWSLLCWLGMRGLQRRGAVEGPP